MLLQPILAMAYQCTAIGERQTVICLFIKYTPREFEVHLVGTGNEPSQHIGKWQKAEITGMAISLLV